VFVAWRCSKNNYNIGFLLLGDVPKTTDDLILGSLMEKENFSNISWVFF